MQNKIKTKIKNELVFSKIKNVLPTVVVQIEKTTEINAK